MDAFKQRHYKGSIGHKIDNEYGLVLPFAREALFI
jgi:hypothetical protein